MTRSFCLQFLLLNVSFELLLSIKQYEGNTAFHVALYLTSLVRVIPVPLVFDLSVILCCHT